MEKFNKKDEKAEKDEKRKEGPDGAERFLLHLIQTQMFNPKLEGPEVAREQNLLP